MSLRRHVLELLARHLIRPLPLRLSFWDGEDYEFSDAPAVTVTLRTPRCARMMLTGNLDRLCDAYVSGELWVEGAMRDILRVGFEVAALVDRIPLAASLMQALARTAPKMTFRARDAKQALQGKDDAPNDFYELWLDKYLINSCAYFRDGTEDIDKAQRQKLDHICRKLMLEPQDRVLDIGCGWGALLCWAALRHQVYGVGVTVSRCQFDRARGMVSRNGLNAKVDIRLQDYRAIDDAGSFDKIASVGMYEHVGLNDLQAYFNQIAKLLRPGGLMLNQGIYLLNADGRAKGAHADFISRHVFPGGATPTLPAIMQHVSKAGLDIADFEDLRPHYARTVSLWLDRLEKREHEAIACVGAERYRTWRMILGSMAYAFDAGWLSAGQILAYKPASDDVRWRPWTREHQYTDVAPIMTGRLEWVHDQVIHSE
jgi:cyclopropane-fatty-acyl-phospholipid synthase